MGVNNDTVRLVFDYFGHLNHSDLEAAASAIDAAAIQEFKGPKPLVLRGAAAIRAHLAEASPPDAFYNIRRFAADDAQVAVALECESGRGSERGRRDEAHVFLVRDGRIKKITSYVFDPRYF